MSKLFSDISYALRQMRKAPGFTLVAVVTLALGIGANAAIFTLIHAMLLRPLPVKNPSALYRLGATEVGCCVTSGFQDEWDLYSYALYRQIKSRPLSLKTWRRSEPASGTSAFGALATMVRPFPCTMSTLAETTFRFSACVRR